MRVDDILVEAARPLWRHKLRSLLSVLSIVMGVASVIALMTLMQAASQGVGRRLDALGANLVAVTVNPLAASTGGTPTLTLPQALSLAKIPGVAGVAPAAYAAIPAERAGREAPVTVYATWPTFTRIMGYHVAIGRNLSMRDESASAALVVLGSAAAQALFPHDGHPIGRTVVIGGEPYRVTGVLAPKGSLFGVNEDAVAILPLTTYQRAADNGSVTSVYVQAQNPARIRPLMRELADKLGQWLGPQNQYTVVAQSLVLGVVHRISRLLTDILAGVASISIVVGGLGILNVHLMAVAERIREIGVRKSVGARRCDILVQFLAEAVLIAGIGGVIGTGLGVALSQAIGQRLGLSVVVNLRIVEDALVISLLLGVAVGLYPALRAAALAPVEALTFDR
ncbi:MAG: ABC transporter permease [Firmicutes bacterium]|nr:ABC transporter permease [Bacillota bacterium]